jgi:CheY-like chemotaxis protein
VKILLVEDDEIKGGEILSFINEEYSEAGVTWKKSFHGALRELVKSADSDIMILDMSLPNHDAAAGDLSGTEHFAGRDLLMQMKFRDIRLPTIVVTMFDSFGEGGGAVSFDELGKEMAAEFPENFAGLVYYSLAQVGWRVSLGDLINSVVGER